MRQRNSESTRGREQSWLLRQFVRPVQPHIGENVAALPQSLVIGGIILVMFVAFVVLYNLVGGALAPGTSPKTKPTAGISFPALTPTRSSATVPATVAITPTRATGTSPVSAATATTVPPTVAPPTALPIGATIVPTVPPAAAGTKYKVKAGDTLLSIAVKYGVSVQSIMTANNLKNDTIYAGEDLIIPPK